MKAPLRSSTLVLLILSACTEQKAPDFPEPESLPSFQVKEAIPETVPFGQPIDLTIRVSAEERLTLPPTENWFQEPIELLEASSTDVQTGSGWKRDFDVRIAAYAVTNTVVFASSLQVENQEIELPFVSLEVTSRLEGEETALPMFGSEDLPDFRGPEALRRQRRNLWISLGAALVLAALAAFALWKWRHRVIPPPPPVPAHVTAFQALEELEQTPAWTRPDVDAAAVSLSLILRTYIEDRFGIQAPDLTTEEFLIAVEEQSPWPEEHQAGLKRFFTATDRIKFAGERPEREVLDELMASVREFITSTRQEETA